jgi:dTMP kinase
VASAFRALAERDPDGFARIDAIGDPLAVHHRVLAAVAPLIESPRA